MAQVLSCEFSEICENNFFTEHVRTTASISTGSIFVSSVNIFDMYCYTYFITLVFKIMQFSQNVRINLIESPNGLRELPAKLQDLQSVISQQQQLQSSFFCFRQNTYSLSVVSILDATGELRYAGILSTILYQLY